MIKTMKGILLASFIVFGFLSPSAYGQLNSSHYLIYHVPSGTTISFDKMVELAAEADVLFFGEEHNDSVAHYLEFEIAKAMHKKHGDQFAVGMEMFERDVQDVMNEYLMGSIREKHFNKDARLWSNYPDYKPIVEYAKENKVPVICSNAASRYTNLAGRKGQKALMELPAESKKNFAPLPYDTASGPYYDKLMGLMNHTPVTTPTIPDTTQKVAPPISNPMGSFNLIMGQSLWDATMAWSVNEYLKKNKKDKVLHINGSFHSNEGFGIVTQLKKYRPKTKIQIISCTSDENFPKVNWEDYKSMGDFIIITDPAVPKTFED
jgi:uncharacterized iron-regulated protein